MLTSVGVSKLWPNPTEVSLFWCDSQACMFCKRAHDESACEAAQHAMLPSTDAAQQTPRSKKLLQRQRAICWKSCSNHNKSKRQVAPTSVLNELNGSEM